MAVSSSSAGPCAPRVWARGASPRATDQTMPLTPSLSRQGRGGIKEPSRQFLGDLFVEDFFHGQGRDHYTTEGRKGGKKRLRIALRDPQGPEHGRRADFGLRNERQRKQNTARSLGCARDDNFLTHGEIPIRLRCASLRAGLGCARDDNLTTATARPLRSASLRSG